MALVLKRGFEHVPSGQMQSYFQSVPGAHDGSQSRHPPLPSHGLDGCNDHDENHDHSRSDHVIQNENFSVANKVVRHVESADQLNLNDKSVEQDLLHDETDPYQSRRKRRKITPKKNHKGGDHITLDAYTRSAKGDSDIGRTRHDKSRNENAERDSERIQHSASTEDSPPAVSQDDAPHTPKRGTVGRRKNQSRVKADGVNQQTTSTIATVSPSNSKRSTPKKALTLHTNGKLLSSPVKKSPVSVKLKDIDNNPEKRSTIARNFKMRNGKFVQTMEIVLRYGRDENQRGEFGRRIDDIISKPSTIQPVDQGQDTKTHPLFSLGKRKSKNDGSSSNSQAETQQKDPVAWKDIKFSSQRPATLRPLESFRPIWPPLQIHHVGIDPPTHDRCAGLSQVATETKQKSRPFQLQGSENVLLSYSSSLIKEVPETKLVQGAIRRHLTGEEVAQSLALASTTRHVHEAISSTRSKLISGTTAFDRGEYAGPNIWPVQYAPSRWAEVLQPAAEILHSWLSGLAVHNVQSGVDVGGKKQKIKTKVKKKRPKSKDSLAAFVVESDDEEGNDTKATKNVILITGPHGCGKTASVFAVAKELGFEIFEIHPGMRRSGKDIFDKVGDMAHNHLVQQGADISRSSSVAPSDVECNTSTRIDPGQTNVANFFSTKNHIKGKAAEDTSTARTKREQKQSLILFEEVDLLFEDDKGFWAGVQNLSKASKRPIILTCNSTKDVPLDDLDLHDILTYDSVETDIATDYLQLLTSAEGHIVDREALSTLYESKGRDLRAAITELNFWCQMTVGSEFAGLDWMEQIIRARSGTNSVRSRTFSEGTFRKSLDLMPQPTADESAAIRFKQETLGIPASEWCDVVSVLQSNAFERQGSILEALDKLSITADAQSTIDILTPETAPEVASAAAAVCHTGHLALNRADTVDIYNQRFKQDSFSRMDVLRTLKPITVEKAVFPPSQGRLAPSIDSPHPSVVLDVAPYVRCIVEYDQRLERYREEHYGSQGKARNTRAARAAAEGGDKASTRTERWFPKDVSFEQIQSTAGGWPLWHSVNDANTFSTHMEMDGEQ